MKGVLPAELIQLTPNEWTEPFWRAAAEHRLVVPRCTELPDVPPAAVAVLLRVPRPAGRVDRAAGHR